MKPLGRISLPAIPLLALMLTGLAQGAEAPTRSGPARITIYNNDFALVGETYLFRTSKGATQISLEGLPRRIDSTSVRLRSDGFRVLRQSFRYDLWNAERVFRNYLGDSIAYRYGGRRYQGRLVGIEGDDLFIERRDSVGVLTMMKRSQITELEFPSKRALATRPSLIWHIESPAAKEKVSGDLSYITSGVQWTAEYSAVLDEAERSVALTGWATVVNRSGTTYEGASVSLVAGDLHRAGETPDRGPAMEAAEPGAAPRGAADLFAYHVYPIQGAVDLRHLETVQAPLFAPARVAARRAYVYDGARDGSKVRVRVEFVNDKESGLGIPLPAGRVRLFASDASSASILIGEDAIGHTPAGERIKLLSGTAFDLVGDRARVAHTRVSRNVTEDQYRIAIRNRGSKAATITVLETLYGNWEVTAKSAEFLRKDAESVEFNVTVSPAQESVLTYTVRFTY